MDDNFFCKLSAQDEKSFRQWARSNWHPGDEIKEVWHPVVRDECRQMQIEFDQSRWVSATTCLQAQKED